jgi:hypothetical protein
VLRVDMDGPPAHLRALPHEKRIYFIRYSNRYTNPKFAG